MPSLFLELGFCCWSGASRSDLSQRNKPIQAQPSMDEALQMGKATVVAWVTLAALSPHPMAKSLPHRRQHDGALPAP